jgi:hypothetical protein
VTPAPHAAAPTVDSGYCCVLPAAGTTMYVTVGDAPMQRAALQSFPEVFTPDCPHAPWVHDTQSLIIGAMIGCNK